MPVCFPDCAGKPYRPSNGTCGDMFMEEFCYRCKKEDFNEETGEGGCNILLSTMCYEIGDPEYPKEWMYNAEGCPTCTAFEKRK